MATRKLIRVDRCGHTALEVELLDALEDIVEGAAADGFYLPTKSVPAHRVGCECGWCVGLRLIAYAGGGGQCVVCGCHDDRACAEGCAWVEGGMRLICTAHPPRVIAAAKKLIRRETRGVRGGRRA